MIRIHMAGTGGLLLDAATSAFDAACQRRIWAAARALDGDDAVLQAVPGVNNLLVTFDARITDPQAVDATLRAAWDGAQDRPVAARTHVIPVTYDGEDLDVVAEQTGLSRDEVAARHAAGTYSVAAIGAMPGFAYMTGLDARLCVPRRPSPRLSVREGAVMIGGGHAGIIPCTAPSGWHILGWTTCRLFDPAAAEPCLLRIGDVVRFEKTA